jgi:alpha-L-fucosidase
MNQLFKKLKFGMFIHYNLATYTNEQWVKGYLEPKTFDPGGTIDTDAWADAAKSAGMTYAVLTTKHVSGFCLWDSQHTTYSVTHPDCPYQQDLVEQFVKSFSSRGLKVGLYYLWRHPGFDANEKDVFKVMGPECDPATHTMEEQVDFQKKQIKELVEKFPQCFYIWNDGLDPDIMPREEAKEFFQSLGPKIIASTNWWDWKLKGTPFLDVAIKETRHFPEDNTFLSETCWKAEDNWFWHKDTTTASYDDIRTAMDTAYDRNSNFLLNVGPDKNGEILPETLKLLQKIGQTP